MQVVLVLIILQNASEPLLVQIEYRCHLRNDIRPYSTIITWKPEPLNLRINETIVLLVNDFDVTTDEFKYERGHTRVAYLVNLPTLVFKAIKVGFIVRKQFPILRIVLCEIRNLFELNLQHLLSFSQHLFMHLLILDSGRVLNTFALPIRPSIRFALFAVCGDATGRGAGRGAGADVFLENDSGGKRLFHNRLIDIIHNIFNRGIFV